MPIPANNEILPFSDGGGANNETQAAYLADAQRSIGNQPGIARAPLVNKALKQVSKIAAAVAQFIANRQATDVTDLLTTAQLDLLLSTAINANTTAVLNVAGTADALIANFTPAATTRQSGIQFAKALADNATTTPTLARDAQAAKVMVKGGNAALAPGDIKQNGIIAFYWDPALDKEVLLNPATGVTAPATATSGPRQTVLSGPLDVNGYSAFGGVTGSTTVTATGTLVVSAAAGFSSVGGQLDRLGQIVNPSWTGLNTNGTMHLFLDVAANGVCTPGSGTLQPQYQQGGAYSGTAGQMTFNWGEMIGKVANVASYRVYVGQVTVAGGVVTAIVWFPTRLGQKQYSPWVTPLPASGSNVPWTHNSGTNEIDAMVEIECIANDAGYVVGDRSYLFSVGASGTYIVPSTPWHDRLNAGLGLANGSTPSIAPKAGGASVGITVGNWKIRGVTQRSF